MERPVVMPRVQVTCQVASHERRIVVVGTFERAVGGVWNEALLRSRRADVNLDSMTEERLDAENQTAQPADEPQRALVRSRFKLRCRLCGLDVPTRQETLSAVLERAHTAGVSVLVLGDLATRLR